VYICVNYIYTRTHTHVYIYIIIYNTHTYIQVMNRYAATLEINQTLTFATSEGASLSCHQTNWCSGEPCEPPGEEDEYHAFFPYGWLHHLHASDLYVLSSLPDLIGGPIGHMRFSKCSQVYGMNFENTSGTPTIPFLLEEKGYTYFWQLGQVMADRFFHFLFVICS
jgi:hypothetical protein